MFKNTANKTLQTPLRIWQRIWASGPPLLILAYIKSGKLYQSSRSSSIRNQGSGIKGS